MRRIAASFVFLVFVCSSLAMAQAVVLAPVGDTVITGQPIINAALQWLAAFTMALIPVVIAWLSIMVNRKWGVQIDAGLRDSFQSQLINGAGTLIQRLGPMAANLTRLDVGNPTVREVVQGVINGAPDVMKRWPEITPEVIAKKLESKLGLLTGVTDASGAPVGAAKPSIPVAPAPGGLR